MVLEQVAFADLPGWRDDDLSAALPALRQSCAALSKGPPTDEIGTPFVPMTVADWAPACAAIAGDVTSDPERLRALLESQFVALRVSHPPAQEGLFTGYFEPELAGARQRSTTYRYPLFRKPEDLVSIDLGSFQPELNGTRLMGRVDKGKLVPYFPRGAIDAGALSGRDLELLWLKDPIDSFLLHVQGSGRVVLPNGEVVRIGFAAHNGHGYVSIGRALIERGALERHEASWDGIRGWIERNPDQRDSLLAVNPRFIFFREIDGDGPIGSQGVPLTPGRSLAVDPAFVPLGVPLWLDTTWPGEEDQPLRRLVVAQDTGGAIKGPVRGDLFWGYGDSALAIAGRMKSRGTFFLLVPRPTATRLAREASAVSSS